MIKYGFFENENIIAGFSERSGGVSPMPENSLNLSFSREPGANRLNVLENYRIAASQLSVEPGSVTRMSQVHGSDVIRIGEEHRGMGVTRELPGELSVHGYDGMITNVPGITLSTTHADCTPVLLYDPENGAIGAVHSGWKGTCLKIAAETVKRMEEEFGSRPENVKAVIGPAISLKHFEVRKDVYEQFIDAFSDLGRETLFGLIKKDGTGDNISTGGAIEADPKWHIDMRGFVKLTLIRCGLLADNIFDDDLCTFSDPSRFFSHRRDGTRSGAMAAFIAIRK